MTVLVLRNPSGPGFLQDPYIVTIPQNQALGETVLNSTAVDSDGVSFIMIVTNLFQTIYLLSMWTCDDCLLVFLIMAAAFSDIVNMSTCRDILLPICIVSFDWLLIVLL